MRAELVGDQVEVEIYSGNREIKEIPGARYSSEIKRWTIPLSWAACVQLRSVLGSELEIGPALLEWGKRERDVRVAQAEEARAARDAGDPTRSTTRAGESGEKTVANPEDQWWWEIWQGMPEFVNRDLSSWRVIKVHVRNRDDLDEFARRMEQTVSPSTRSIWFPMADKRDESAWRWVDEAEDSANLPSRSRKPTDYDGKKPDRPAKQKKLPKPKRVAVRDTVGGGMRF